MRKIVAKAALLISIFSAAIFSQGKISGLVYTDYFYNVSRDTGFAALKNTAVNGEQDLNGFDLRRIYFTNDYKIDDRFSTRFRLEADGRTLSQNYRFSVFVKDAFLKWRDILPGQDLIFGIQPTPAFEVSESYYGFRSLEKTILDLRGIVSSRDFGLSFRGKITEELNYVLLIANNTASSPETNKYKRIYAHIGFKPFENFSVTVYTDLAFRNKINDPSGPSGALMANNINTSALFLGYSDSENFSIGSEVFYRKIQNGNTKDEGGSISVADLNSVGVSVFTWFKLYQGLLATARYDFYDPGLNSDLKYDRRNFFILGLSYSPAERVAIIPNVMIESYDDLPGISIDPSVTARITLTYEFF